MRSILILKLLNFFLLRTESLGDCVSGDGGLLNDASAYLLLQYLPVSFRHSFEMLVLTVEMQEVKVKEIVRFGDLANNDVVAVVNVLGGADLDHLDVTERAIGRALSYREAAVAKVHQHLAPPCRSFRVSGFVRSRLGVCASTSRERLYLFFNIFRCFISGSASFALSFSWRR